MKNKKMIIVLVIAAVVVAGYMYAKKNRKSDPQEV